MEEKYIHLIALAVNLYFNSTTGERIGAVSDLLGQGFSIFPADYAFAIWGLIYLGQIYYVALLFFNPDQVFDSIEEKGFQLGFLNNLNLTQKKTFYFVLVSILNSTWLYSWSSFKVDSTPIFFYFSPVLLLGICLGLYKLWVNLNEPIPANLIALYLAWCAGAFLLNLFVTYGFTKDDNMKRVLSILTAFSQVAFFIAWPLIFNSDTDRKKSVAIPLVGLWTGLAVYLKSDNAEPYLLENIWLLALSSIQVSNKIINSLK